MNLHPELACQLANQHAADLRREAHRGHAARLAVAGRSATLDCLVARGTGGRQPATLRERTGWALIYAGLRLTGPPTPQSRAS